MIPSKSWANNAKNVLWVSGSVENYPTKNGYPHAPAVQQARCRPQQCFTFMHTWAMDVGRVLVDDVVDDVVVVVVVVAAGVVVVVGGGGGGGVMIVNLQKRKLIPEQ